MRESEKEDIQKVAEREGISFEEAKELWFSLPDCLTPVFERDKERIPRRGR